MTDQNRAYVLDTNVLLHDPAALFSFQEHDIYLPLVVLEELDRHKKGVADLARNARQVTRSLDLIFPSELDADGDAIDKGFDLQEASNGKATGKLYFRGVTSTKDGEPSLNVNFEAGKADNVILATAKELIKSGLHAALVTKDINLRVKAMASGVPAQDYRTDRVFTDSDILPTGILHATEELWESVPEGDSGVFRLNGVNNLKIAKQLPINSFVHETTNRNRSRLWRVTDVDSEGAVLSQLNTSAPADSHALLSPRNDEQVMALNLLFDKDVDAVVLVGQAGTGKTLLALAAGLEQVKNDDYSGVLLTRATVPVGDDIGFLPGSEEEKMGAWLGAVEDCYEVINPDSTLKEKVKIKSMAFMRGRSFQKKFIIIDEAQNLTTKQIRTLLTRAGEGSKVILTGNLAQIDTPYLDEGSSGLAWAVMHLQNWKHAGHLILPRGERSRLATFVEEVAESDSAKAR